MMDRNIFVKKIQNIMRQDEGVDGDAERIKQITWLIFLKAYDANEKNWELNDDYKSLIPNEFRWDSWALDKKDGKCFTGKELIDFVNTVLLPFFKGEKVIFNNKSFLLKINEWTPNKQRIIRDAFENTNNSMENGVLLRQVINLINEYVNFDNCKEVHEFGIIYETFLKDLQNANNYGEYYTPRPLTDYIIETINPKIGESIADFACGTGGFLTSALNFLYDKVKNTNDRKMLDNAVYGIEKKPLPYLLCVTNMLIHEIDEPKIYKGNALERNVKEYKEKDKFDIIVMNPPYGGNEQNEIKNNFPIEFRSKETFDLFMVLIMYRLKTNGKAAVILPDSFLFSDDNNYKKEIKKKLFGEFNVESIIRLPKTVFAPYTPIATNIIFFNNNGSTKETWFYRVDMPENYKSFSKTKPLLDAHLKELRQWYNNKQEIKIKENYKAKKVSIDDIIRNNFNLDFCSYKSEEKVFENANTLIKKFLNKNNMYTKKIEKELKKIMVILNDK